MLKVKGMTITTPDFQTIPTSYVIYKTGNFRVAEPAKRSGLKRISGTDASTVIQSAIDALTSEGKIFIKAGVYNITKTIKVKNNYVLLEGESFGSTRFDLGFDGVLLQLGDDDAEYEHITVRNLQFKGNRPNFSGSAIKVQNTARAVIEGCWIRDFSDYGIWVRAESGYDSRDARIVSNYLSQMLIHSIFLDVRSDDAKVFLNTITQPAPETTGDAIRAVENSYYMLKNTIAGGLHNINLIGAFDSIVVGNACDAAFRDAIRVYGDSNKSIIMSNRVYNASQENNNTYDGIHVEGTSTYVADGIIIVGNVIRATATNKHRDGIHLYQYVNNCILAGNRISDSQNYAIRIYSDLCNDNIVTDNNVKDNVSPILDAGSNTKLGFNAGYVTENSGTATITSGSTYVDVSHGLAITPDLAKISLTPQDDLGGRSIWVSDANSLTFRINISSIDSVDHVIGWSYGGG